MIPFPVRPEQRSSTASIPPFVLSLSKHRPSSAQEEKQPFDKLRANGDLIPNGVVALEALA
jgi:hypothetical protein